jgi:hypothetical protein
MNIYFTLSFNSGNNIFRKTLLVSLILFAGKMFSQNLYTVAGNGGSGYSGDGGLATSATLNTPLGVGTDLSGNVYIADFSNNRIRKVNVSTGIITTVAGTGSAGYNGDGILATSAALKSPFDVCTDKFGNIYIADEMNYRVRKITISTGLISTVAGTGVAGDGSDGILATSCQLSQPKHIAVDTAGNIYISDYKKVRKVTITTGLISTIAGTSNGGYNGDDIPAITAQLGAPVGGIALDAAGNIYIADETNHRLRKVTRSTGLITTLAGNGFGGFSSDGIAASSSQLNYPNSVSLDATGNIYIADMNNNRIRKISASTGIISTVAGDGNNGSSPDGTLATAAQIDQPYDVELDLCGNIIIGAAGYGRVREVRVLNFTISSHNTSCTESSATASVSGGTPPYNYLWSNGSTNSVNTALTAGTYSVTITDSVGCLINSSITIDSLPPPPAPNICLVTVDDGSVNNIIYWNKTPYTSADSFIVYREVSTSVYKRIGAVSNDSLSEFIDTARSIGPANGNPNVGAYRYKLQIKDTCGLLSPLGPYHNTIYIINAGLGQFTWSIPYSIEGAPNPAQNYVLLCDSANVNVWWPVAVVSGTQSSATDPGYASHSAIANWRVRTFWNITCTPTRATVNTTRSNIRHGSISTGIRTEPISSMLVYPNPASDEVTIELPPVPRKISIRILNSIGQVVFEENMISSDNSGIVKQINTSGFAKGIYTISIDDTYSKIYKKLAVN